MQCKTIAVDLAKNVFQVSFADERNHVVKRSRLSRVQFQRLMRRSPPAQWVMEGCASAHYWGRQACEHGHQVKLLHAKYVKAYVRRNKTDSADADALVRANLDPDLIPIAVKSEHQQAVQSLHAIRSQWRQSLTARINEARGVLAEFGLVLPAGSADIGRRLHHLLDQLPPLLHDTFTDLIAEINQLKERVVRIDRQLKRFASEDPVARRLLTVTGVGPTIATAMIGRVPNIHGFKRGRAFASWLGITPLEFSSGSNRRLGKISRRGDTYLRTLLIHGARTALLAAKRQQKAGQPLTRLQAWAIDTQERIGHNKAAVAMANKMARIIWALWTRGGEFNGNDALRFG